MVFTEDDWETPIILPRKGTISIPEHDAPRIIEGTHVVLDAVLHDTGVIGVTDAHDNYELLSAEKSQHAGSITYEGRVYEFAQMHMHSPSENQLEDDGRNGRKLDLEMHLVHKSADKKVCVLAIMFEQGEVNDEFEHVLDAIAGLTRPSKPIDITKMLGQQLLAGKKLMTLKGSLTTPPYNRGVQWIFSRGIAKLSHRQLIKFNSFNKINFGEHGNIRETCPINERPIITYY